MSSREELTRDSLAQHRRELDGQFELLVTIREHLTADVALDRVVWRAIEEVRTEVRAVANRVESLTRAIGANGGEHSVRAVSPAAGFALVVVDVESDIPELLGSYSQTVEDTVEYRKPDGELSYAPADCVKVVAFRDLARTLSGAASS